MYCVRVCVCVREDPSEAADATATVAAAACCSQTAAACLLAPTMGDVATRAALEADKGKTTEALRQDRAGASATPSAQPTANCAAHGN